MADPTTKEVSDERWVALARQGDAEAFEELVRRHQRGLYGFCRRLTGDHERADEAAQEAFVRAYCALESFRGEASFGTWLRQIALNVVRTTGRRHKRETEAPAPEEAGPADARPAADPILRKRLDAAVARLPERQRLALLLKVCGERTHAEVAEILGCTIGTVKANLFHALRRMRRLMGEK
jgi:RNA polymerase sigma-70 factor (ECF subfamily)